MAGGKTYQVTQVDPLNPHTKGMVYQVNIVGGGTQMEELPEASADNVGQVYQYLGETGSGLTHGFFYESQALGTTPETYGWVAVNVQQGGATNSATTDLSNLTATGANITNWSSNVSNCITEIPQDIKLTLSNGTLTLKAGSKVYKPDGTYITIDSDISTTSGINGTALVAVHTNGSALYFQYPNNCVSGPTDSKAGETYHWWFDTTNNVINRYTSSGTTPYQTTTFPVALVTTTSGTITSIDQVFNGFGYIGSNVFTLPGVKGLYPNGRNADGTLKSGSINCTSVQVSSTFNDTNKHILIIQSNGRCQWYAVGRAVYNEKDNVICATSDGVHLYVGLFGTFDTTSGVISNFEPHTVFHAVDYNNTEYIAHQAMPSKEHINLTLGASSTNYIAAVDGYMFLNMTAGVGYGKIDMWNKTAGLRMTARASSVTGEWVYAFVPVSKGDEVNISYTTTGAVNEFYVVYANGAK